MGSMSSLRWTQSCQLLENPLSSGTLSNLSVGTINTGSLARLDTSVLRLVLRPCGHVGSVLRIGSSEGIPGGIP